MNLNPNAANGDAAVNSVLFSAPLSDEIPAGEDTSGGEPQTQSADNPELSGMTTVELKALAKKLGLVGYSSMNKIQLIEAITEAGADGTAK